MFGVQVLNAVQRLQKVFGARAAVSEKLESSLRDLARTGDVATAKAVRKTADASLKESGKELKAIYESLPPSSRSTVLAKVWNLASFFCSAKALWLQKYFASITVMYLFGNACGCGLLCFSSICLLGQQLSQWSNNSFTSELKLTLNRRNFSGRRFDPKGAWKAREAATKAHRDCGSLWKEDEQQRHRQPSCSLPAEADSFEAGSCRPPPLAGRVAGLGGARLTFLAGSSVAQQQQQQQQDHGRYIFCGTVVKIFAKKKKKIKKKEKWLSFV